MRQAAARGTRRTAARSPAGDVVADGVFLWGSASVALLLPWATLVADDGPWPFWTGFVQAAWLVPAALVQQARGRARSAKGILAVAACWLALQLILSLAFGLVPAVNTP